MDPDTIAFFKMAADSTNLHDVEATKARIKIAQLDIAPEKTQGIFPKCVFAKGWYPYTSRLSPRVTPHLLSFPCLLATAFEAERFAGPNFSLYEF